LNFIRDLEAQRTLAKTCASGLLSIFDLQASADRYLASIGAV